MTTRITSENITDATIGIADLASSVPLNTQWQAVKTSTFTAVAGEGYFVNSGSALTMNLPAGVAGATVVVADYARNFATYNLTVSPNGSEKIGGVANDATLDVNGQAATFVYIDATKGWINIQNAEDTETGVIPYLSATGGTITESGNFKIHTFTGDGDFVVNRLATESPAPIYNTVSYLVVAGGGGGGGTGTTTHTGAGGGAGGYRGGRNQPVDSYTESPLCASTGLPVGAATYPITVGGGGAPPSNGPQRGGTGSNSVFSTITSAGGGGGGSLGHPSNPACRGGGDGGSGGGGSSQVAGPGGCGNVPPVSPPQGTNGAQGIDSPPDLRAGSGGGATAAGSQGSPTAIPAVGGAGATVHITGSPVAYAGGGGAGSTSGAGPNAGGAGGAGGGGQGGCAGSVFTGNNGTANTGGGGGGAAGNPSGSANKLGGTGGSGVVILRYRFQ